MDIGSAVSRAKGVSEAQILELAQYRDSAAFDARERAVLDYATAMAATPTTVSPAVFAAVRAHLDDAQLVELTATIAWENFRARFNRAFEIEADGFAEGAACALPVHGGAALGAGQRLSAAQTSTTSGQPATDMQ
jgi:4-carboxymuconolactone decarboxylase